MKALVGGLMALGLYVLACGLLVGMGALVWLGVNQAEAGAPMMWRWLWLLLLVLWLWTAPPPNRPRADGHRPGWEIYGEWVR